jgi:hypothetical protein
MRKFFIAVSAIALSAMLVGCSAFYPNWGATGLPEEPETLVTEEPAPAATESEAEESLEPEPTESESPEATEEATVQRKQVQVEIIMASPEPDFGVLTVVAFVPALIEIDGKCTMRFIGSDKEASMEVPADPSSDYMQCALEVPLADLPSGNGIVTVSYESATHFGASPATSVVIP